MTKTILVTGAAGYIGGHACVELMEAGHDVVGIDNHDNSSDRSIRAVETLVGRRLQAMYKLDLRDRNALNEVFNETTPDAVIHLAGLKSVAESIAEPIRYFDNNVGSTLSLLEVMDAHRVHDLVFSSSCTVYGSPGESVAIDEQAPRRAINPYGRTKVMIEEILEDLCEASEAWRVLSLRYFNPIGAHPSGSIGDDPVGVPTNLVPYAMQVAVGRRDILRVFGRDYPTDDGTCIRDYLHVVDLARGHAQALDALHNPGFEAINLGTGVGHSVLDVIGACESAVGHPIPHEFVDRRDGDAIAIFADPSLALERLKWKAEFDLQQMCDDHWRWQYHNPNGYCATRYVAYTGY